MGTGELEPKGELTKTGSEVPEESQSLKPVPEARIWFYLRMF